MTSLKIGSIPLDQEDRLIYVWLVLDLKHYGVSNGNIPSYTDISDSLDEEINQVGATDGAMQSDLVARKIEIIKALRYLSSLCVGLETEERAIASISAQKLQSLSITINIDKLEIKEAKVVKENVGYSYLISGHLSKLNNQSVQLTQQSLITAAQEGGKIGKLTSGLVN